MLRGKRSRRRSGHRVLAVELETAELATSEAAPEDSLGFSGVVTEVLSVALHRVSETPRMGHCILAGTGTRPNGEVDRPAIRHVAVPKIYDVLFKNRDRPIESAPCRRSAQRRGKFCAHWLSDCASSRCVTFGCFEAIADCIAFWSFPRDYVGVAR